MPKLVPIDLLNEIVEETLFSSRHREELKKLEKQPQKEYNKWDEKKDDKREDTNFNKREVEALAFIHHAIEKSRGPITRSVYRDVAHEGFDFTENVRHLLVDRVYSQIDQKNTLKIPCEAFVYGLSPMLRGDLEEKTKFAYKVYDLMKGNRLTKEQIFPMLRGCLIKMPPEENPDENVRDMVDLLIKSIDLDRDGEVSQEEFLEAVRRKNSLFLECMGPVLPSREATHAFLTTFTDDVPKF